MAVKVFVSYSHADNKLRAQLEEHLAQLQREGRVAAWTDRRIPPGAIWGTAIDEALEAADIILLLVSSAFLASDYCNGVELERALERHQDGTARMIPVIVRPCDWKTARFGKFQVLPRHGKPVKSWDDRDEAWLDVVHGIRKEVTRSRRGDAFLSHNSADTPLVKEIGRWLADEAGLEVVLDEWNLIPGEPRPEGLEQALDASRCCVVFLGRSGIGPWGCLRCP